ncbi:MULTISPECIES: GntR family transcriptional regulator [Streptomyces]|uniref:GntR family transcriptional regulator n=1 Tax=Streptomyces TaxID=1883 RepID=UPI0004C62DAF|nr:GntR family transcriptional regulator [Streptomyces virginiae]
MTGATHRLADALRAAIEAGDYPPGAALPSAERLAEEHGVARATAQKAVQQLAAEGYLTLTRRHPARVKERPRHTTVVRDRVVYRDDLGYFFDRNAQDWAAVTPPTRGFEVPPSHVADLLGTTRGQDVLARRRLMGPRGATVAHQVAVSFIPLSVVAEIPEVGAERTGSGGIYDRFEEHYRAPLEWRETVSARHPNPEEQKALGVPASSPVLVVTREARIRRDGEEVVVEVNETAMAAAQFAVSYHVERDESATWPRAS